MVFCILFLPIVPPRSAATLEFVDGVIVVDKPAGWTSHDVVGKLRRLANERRIGHLGTLDPLATGVLPLIVGKATRLARFFTANEKRYEAVIRFGLTTDSYDRDGTVTSTADAFQIGRNQLEASLSSFRGTFAQRPPPVSAKKVGGMPAYKLTRKNIAVELKPVEVTVLALDVLDFDGVCARVMIHCTGGTYVRSIAHDLGQKLRCGAIIESLRRLSSGDFTIDQSHTIERLQAMSAAHEIEKAVIAASSLLPAFPAERIDSSTASQIRQGKDFRLSPFRARPDALMVKAIGEQDELVAIGELRLPNLYHPILVL